MIALPLSATIVAVVFTIRTWRAAPARVSAMHVWSIALAQFALASAALVWGTAFGWSPLVYRVFYLFGAVLNVAWLGLGTLWLLLERRVAWPATVVLLGASAWAAVAVATAELTPHAAAALRLNKLPIASVVLTQGVRVFSRWFSIGGSLVVLGGLAWAVVHRRHVLGLALLAAGVVVLGGASELARQTGLAEGFSAGLALGISLMFAGFERVRSEEA